MAEYIERQEIFDAIDLLVTRFPYKVPGRPDTYHPYNEAWCDACSHALDLIRHHPPADVVPVVRCRDCDSWNKDDIYGYAKLGNLVCSCSVWSNEGAATRMFTRPDEFCSRGVRREEDEG